MARQGRLTYMLVVLCMFVICMFVEIFMDGEFWPEGDAHLIVWDINSEPLCVY